MFSLPTIATISGASQQAAWVGAIHILAALLVCAHCLYWRREPTSSLLWMFLAWTLPGIGVILYITIGIYRIPKKAWNKACSDAAFNSEREIREQESEPLSYWKSLLEGMPAALSDPIGVTINRTLDGIDDAHPLVTGNNMKILRGGDGYYHDLRKDIEAAQHHIHIQSYIVANDATGRDLLNQLNAKANEGVQVRLLYDRFGSSHASLTGLFRRYRNIPNLEIEGFTQVNPIKRRFQINLRNHRKITVIDGKIGYTGGMNFLDEHVSRPEHPPIRDYHFRLTGPIVHELQYTFLSDWYYMTGEHPDRLLCEELFPATLNQPAENGHNMRLLNGGPTADAEPMLDLYLTALTAAKKRILAATPYFVPPPELLRALRVAALRGVDVRLVTPEWSNHVTVTMAARAIYNDLLLAGVRIFESPPPLLHSKAMVLDDTVAIVGSANLDNRSLRLNYETNLVVFNEHLVSELAADLVSEFQEAKEVTLPAWNRRPHLNRIAENFCYLLSPAL